MNSHKTQVTTNSVAQPQLTERLNREPSARRRAEIIKRLAEFGALMENVGLANIVGNMVPRPHVVNTSEVSSLEDKPVNSELGDDFFANALSGYMSTSSQESGVEPT